MKLIDKDAVVAEIKRHISIAESQLALFGNEDEKNRIMWAQQKKVCEIILSFFNSIEVKEVDIEREMQAFATLYLEPLKVSDSNIGISITMAQLYSCARGFFNLGLRASNPLTWEDINSILYIERLVLREFGGQEHSNEELCREVLKRFKEQKGERYENNND